MQAVLRGEPCFLSPSRPTRALLGCASAPSRHSKRDSALLLLGSCSEERRGDRLASARPPRPERAVRPVPPSLPPLAACRARVSCFPCYALPFLYKPTLRMQSRQKVALACSSCPSFRSVSISLHRAWTTALSVAADVTPVHLRLCSVRIGAQHRLGGACREQRAARASTSGCSPTLASSAFLARPPQASATRCRMT